MRNYEIKAHEYIHYDFIEHELCGIILIIFRLYYTVINLFQKSH